MAQRTDNRRTDTRDRILTVALGLFAAQGYTNTSLREIADELGVTKAALYFHYKTKEDIVVGILRGHLDDLEELIRDAETAAVTLEGREGLLRRFADLQANRGMSLVRLIRENFTEIGNLPIGAEMKSTHLRLLNALAGPQPTVLARTRARTAFAAIQTTALSVMSGDEPEEEARAAALIVALEVLRGGQHTGPSVTPPAT